jgi:hypothetical protein
MDLNGVESVSKPEPTDAPLQLVWDGVSYDVPINLTPREDGKVHTMTGCWGIDILSEQLPKMTTLGLAALLIVAMERRHGKVDADAILDDQDFNQKLSVHVPEPEVEELPPVVAAPVELPLADAPHTNGTPAVSGSLSS